MNALSFNCWRMCGICVCLVVLIVVDHCRGGTVYFDDFDDGSLTNDVPLDTDNNPVVWTTLTSASVGSGDASTGDLVLTNTSVDGGIGSALAIAANSTPVISDTSVRAQMQLVDGDAYFAVLARGDSAIGNAYQAGINTNSGTAYIARNDANHFTTLVSTPAPVDLTAGNVNIQIDIIGENLSFFIWDEEEQMPAQPLLETEDSSYGSGRTGVILDSVNGAATGVIRFVHVADSPIVPVTPGDFDHDGDVDGDDFLKWQRGESPDPLSPADLAAWASHYGSNVNAPTRASLDALEAVAVPESTTAILLLMAAFVTQLLDIGRDCCACHSQRSLLPEP